MFYAPANMTAFLIKSGDQSPVHALRHFEFKKIRKVNKQRNSIFNLTVSDLVIFVKEETQIGFGRIVD